MFQNQGQCTASLLAVNPVCAYHVVGSIYGVQVCFMLDTGVAVSLLPKDVWDKTGRGHQLTPWTGPRLVGVEGTPLEVHGAATMEITLAAKSFQVDFVVVAVLRTQSILGLDFMENNHCIVNAGQKTLHLRALECRYRQHPECHASQKHRWPSVNPSGSRHSVKWKSWPNQARC